MAEQIRAITWDAPEHHHVEKGSDWFWVLGIIAITGSIAAFFFGNYLFALLIIIGALVITLAANRAPEIIPFAVTARGLRVKNTLYPYSTLESFYLDEEDPKGPQLLAKSKRLFMPLIIMPIPEEYIDDIEAIIEGRLPEEHLEEPLGHKILEIFGF